MGEKQINLITIVFGLLVTALGLYTLGQFPADGHAIPEGYGSPIYAFEFARSQADLLVIFGPASDPAHTARLQAMDAGNLWDYPFMLCYGLFIAGFFLAAAKRSGKSWPLVFAALGIMAALSDSIENQILLGITADLAAAPGLDALIWPVMIKFSLLMICGMAAGVLMILDHPRGWAIAGIVTALSAVLVLPGLIAPAQFGFLIGNGLTLCWTIKLVFVVYRYRRLSPPQQA